MIVVEQDHAIHSAAVVFVVTTVAAVTKTEQVVELVAVAMLTIHLVFVVLVAVDPKTWTAYSMKMRMNRLMRLRKMDG